MTSTTSLQAPSQLSSIRAKDFAGIRPFRKFGTWSEAVSIAYPGATFRLVNWIAQHRRETRDYDTLWRQCIAANPACFQQLEIVNLSKPSWFLPEGGVVFQAIKNPTTIPDNPPRGVLIRHSEALEVFGQHADFYFLRPTFVAESMEVFTGELARAHADEDKSDILFMAKLYGGVLRKADFARKLAVGTASLGMLAIEKGLSGLSRIEQLVTGYVEKTRIRREARGIPSGMHPDTIRALMIRSLELGLYKEADVFRIALNTWERHTVRSHLTGISHGMGLGHIATKAKSASGFLRLAQEQGVTASAAELRVVYQEIQELRRWDPITCFEVRNRPGDLWLEAHWFENPDGKHFVHY